MLRTALAPVSSLFVAMRVPAHGITLLGGVVSIVGCLVLAVLGEVLLGTAIISMGLLCDLLDGLVARGSGTESRLGELTDSLVDRLVEGVVYLSVAWCFFTIHDRPWAALGALTLFTVSYLCSYCAMWSSPQAPRAAAGPISRGGRLACLLVALTVGQWGLHVIGELVLLFAVVASTRTLQLRIADAARVARSDS